MKQFLLSVFLTSLFCFVAFAQDNSKSKSESSNSPKANLNSSLGENKVEGVARLRVTFLASGEIGEITVVSGLPNGLTEQAIAAARKIKFEPAKKDGVAYTVTKLVEYTFTIPYQENDEDLQKKAEITKMPAPKYPKGENLKGFSGKVKVTLRLFANGNVEVSEVKSDLPKEFQENSREAAIKIKFKPAIHKKGNKVTQTKEIEYEFKVQKK